MKSVSILSLSLLATTLFSTSCKKTYECTCPAFTAGASPYIFEVEASSSKSATNKCIAAGKKDPVVDSRDAEQCRVYPPVKK